MFHSKKKKKRYIQRILFIFTLRHHHFVIIFLLIRKSTHKYFFTMVSQELLTEWNKLFELFIFHDFLNKFDIFVFRKIIYININKWKCLLPSTPRALSSGHPFQISSNRCRASISPILFIISSIYPYNLVFVLLSMPMLPLNYFWYVIINWKKKKYVFNENFIFTLHVITLFLLLFSLFWRIMPFLIKIESSLVLVRRIIWTMSKF